MCENSAWKEEIVDDQYVPYGLGEEKKISEIAKTGKVFWNITKRKFGYGDDARDWEQDGDEWAVVEEMQELGDGKLLIVY